MLSMKKFFAFFIPSKQFVPVVECFAAFLVMPGPVLVLVLLHQCSCKLHLEAFWQSTRLATVGQVLNETSVWWFNKTRHITGNSLVVAPDPNVTIARKCSVFPVEFVGMWSSTCIYLVNNVQIEKSYAEFLKGGRPGDSPGFYNSCLVGYSCNKRSKKISFDVLEYPLVYVLLKVVNVLWENSEGLCYGHHKYITLDSLQPRLAQLLWQSTPWWWEFYYFGFHHCLVCLLD